jgi:uncharacterized protein involved in exopolysaccharide biosynthesis
MELVDLARALWRRRLLVLIGVLASLALAGKALTKPRPPASGLAWTRVMIDTPKSQLITPAPDGMDTLIWRAHLLADLMTTQENTDAVARAAGLDPKDVRVQEPLLYTSIVATPLPVAAQKAASIVREPYVVTLQYAWNLPLIEVETGAPDQAGAVKLAKAVTETLAAADTPSPADVAAADKIAAAQASTPNADGTLPPAADSKGVVQPFTAQSAADIQSRVVIARSGRLQGIMMAAVLLVVWCICVPLLPRPRRPRRRAARPQPA